MTALGRDEAALQAYHDGQLRGLARWRFERRLARSPELRRELSALESVRAALRSLAAEPRSPDLWDAIALRLPAEDAKRADRVRPRPWADGWGRLARPAAAAAAAAIAVLALAYGLWPGDPTAPRVHSVVRWMDPAGRSVMLLEGADDATIIWVLDEPVEGASGGGSREVV